jgi:multiple sugar transport system permease protein
MAFAMPAFLDCEGMAMAQLGRIQKHKGVRYGKWGYIFLIPFFVSFTVFTLVPLFNVFYNSFFENYLSGLKQVGPNYIGFQNYIQLFTEAELGKYLWNTVWMWLLGFIPQIVVSLLLAVWFTDMNLKLKGQGFFKTVIYMPNLIMASSFAMLFFTLFSDGGPVNNVMAQLGIPPFQFIFQTAGTRGLTALMNFLMWFGNTTIILMAGVMGIDSSLFEASEIDGASGWQTFWRVTMPLLRPIIAYTLITSMIGGLQMFDVPQILTKGNGTPDRTSMTIIMLLNNYLGKSKNYGLGGALSTVMFFLTGGLSMLVFRSLTKEKREERKYAKMGVGR